jgi:hypothetical protein
MKTISEQTKCDLSIFRKKLDQLQKENIKLWARALKSDAFKQNRGNLHSADNRHCALGVADKICGLKETDLSFLKTTYKKLGLVSPKGSFVGYNSIYQLNDDFGWSLPEIGQLIEDQLQLKT